MFNIGPAEMIVILVIALIVFGPKRLPEIGRTVGRSLQQFREATKDVRQEVKEALTEADVRKDVADAPGGIRAKPATAGPQEEGKDVGSQVT